MEAQSGVEVRRLHIVYFLSRRTGFVEHPHLIRIRHLSRNGVKLRDIKRWLGEVRGKHMPESFAWSYKRKYKTGYVWQDLMDDDLVTPISDNEFVLKGSEICSTTNNTETSSIIRVPTKTSSSEIEEDLSPSFGSETSTLTDDCSVQKLEEELDKNSDKTMQEAKSSTFRPTVVVNKKNEKMISTVKIKASSNKPHFTKNDSNGASNIFRNLITCGAVDTNDSALLVKNKGKSSRSNSKSCYGVKDSATQMAPHAAYKPLNRPNCSQCGKPFKPEKMHAHMKQCKGMKSSTKASSNPAFSATNNARNISQISTKFDNESLISGYLLTR